MTYSDLREMCERYGLQVDFNISGQWAINDSDPGPGYRIYVWEVVERNLWPTRVLKTVRLEELKDMSRDQLEEVVVGCAVEAFGWWDR